MKRILLTISILLCLASQCFADGMVVGSGGAAAPSVCTGLIECQGFEGTGYDNSETWTSTGTGTVDPDYTTAPLAGAQSLRMGGTTVQPRVTHTFASTQTEVWGYFLVDWEALMSAVREFITIYDSVSSAAFTIESLTTGQWSCRIHGSGANNTVSTMSAGTPYHVWYHFKNGSGNAACSIGFSEDGTEPTSGNNYVAKTNGTATGDMVSSQIGWTGNTSGTFIIDKIRTSNTATLGSNPQ